MAATGEPAAGGAAGGSGPAPTPALLRLLEAYSWLLALPATLPPLVPVRARHRGPGPLRRLLVLPRPRWFVTFFVVRHVDRVLQALASAHRQRRALGLASPADRRDLEAVEDFRAALPPLRRTAHTTALLAVAVVFGRVLVEALADLPALAARIDVPSSSGGPGALVRQTERVARELGSVFERILGLAPNLMSVGDLAGTLDDVLRRPQLLVVVAAVIAAVAYVVLRPIVPAFRLKRLLFNLGPEGRGLLGTTTARWHVQRAAGVYDLESAAFAAVGARRPPEIPLDLVVGALPVLVVLAVPLSLPLVLEPEVAGNVIGDALAEGPVLLPLLVLACFLRLGWLARAHRRRREGSPGPFLPFEARIPGSAGVASARGPLAVGFGLVFLQVLLGVALLAGLLAARAAGAVRPEDVELVFLVVALLLNPLPFAGWMLLVNRELRDLGRASGSPMARAPALSFLAVMVGWWLLVPAAVSIHRTARRIRRAVEMAGGGPRVRHGWLLVPGLLGIQVLFLFPFSVWLFGHLQHRLNAVWARIGEPLPDGPPARTVTIPEPVAPPAAAPPVEGARPGA